MTQPKPAAPFVFDPPSRVLLGPGPSDVPARVLSALARPTVGYLDASYTALLETLQQQLRDLFRADYAETLAVTGAGTAAMEAALYNVLEVGDTVVAGVHGYFGDRLRQVAERAGAQVHVVEAPWGEPTSPAAVKAKLASLGTAKVVCVPHGETSTGVCQPIPELAEAAHAHGALMVVDTVASLGGTEFDTAGWGVDVAYTGAQKCISAPPGLSPITFSPRAMEVVRQRKTPCASWYLDLLGNLTVWSTPHKYHHTGSINLVYAMHEALNIIAEEGLAARVDRTAHTARALWAGLEALGVPLSVEPAYRLPTLTAARVPDGVDEARVRAHLMSEYGVEIAGGLGPLAGKIWRIGLMGASCSRRNVMLLLTALEEALREQGQAVATGAGAAAASAVFGED
ncbi:MAG: alanine--glyoxylate aminotransferase family protein [Deltaproteobacteria bacterium]|nr:alanine--glyoxylate aminotransferase family protein [Deltaproteobacteria bacterium]